jgi:hypothetical protein
MHRYRLLPQFLRAVLAQVEHPEFRRDRGYRRWNRFGDGNECNSIRRSTGTMASPGNALPNGCETIGQNRAWIGYHRWT